MITSKDLVNRIYEKRRCIGFDYYLHYDNEKRPLELRYRLINDMSGTSAWYVILVLDVDLSEPKVYNVRYEMPNNNPTLPLVAATGMHHLKLAITEEIQTKIHIDFALGDAISNM